MPENQSQRAYAHIRSKLLEGLVAPGSRLSYGPIGREIGVSATPVREAVGQLASEGFVELVPQLGAIVRDLTRDEAVELYDLREALESYAAERLAGRHGESDLAVLEMNLANSSKLVGRVRASGRPAATAAVAKQFRALDLGFHMSLIEASGNRRMLKVVGDSHILSRIFQADRHRFTLEILQATQSEHEEILAAIRSRQPAAARDAMRRHIRNSLDLTLTAAPGAIPDRWWAR